jgi:hypothetical protein
VSRSFADSAAIRGASARSAASASNRFSAASWPPSTTDAVLDAASNDRHCRASSVRCRFTIRVAMPSSHGSADPTARSNEARRQNATRNVSLSASSTASAPTLRRMYPPTGRTWRSKMPEKASGSSIDRSMISLSVLTLGIALPAGIGSRYFLH